jgi:hypothetical protein
MKRIISMAVLAGTFLMIMPGFGQTSPTKEDETVLALATEIQAQQGQIAGNQTKIDAKMAEVMEAIRVARIFAGRAGR